MVVRLEHGFMRHILYVLYTNIIHNFTLYRIYYGRCTNYCSINNWVEYFEVQTILLIH